MNTYALIDLLNIILAIYLGLVIYLKDPNNNLNRLFVLNCFLSGYTALLELLRFTSESAGAAYLYHKLSFVWPFFPVVLFEFACELTNSRLKAKKVIRPLFIFIAALLSALHLLTDFLYQNLEHKWYGWNYNIVKNSVTAIIPLFVLTSGLISFFLTASYYKKLTDKRKKRQAFFTSVGIIIPVIAGTLINEIIPEIKGEVPPLTGLSYIVSAGFLFVSLLKYKHFSIDPIKIAGQLLAKIEDYVIIFNQEERIIQSSDSFYYWSGYNENEVTGKTLQQFFRGKDFQPGDAEQIIGKELELNLIPFNGSEIPLSAVVSKISDKGNSDNLYLLIGRDLRERKHLEQELLDSHKQLEEKVQSRTLELQKEINERKSAEAALRDSETRYRSIFEGTSEAMLLADMADCRIFEANSAARDFYGYSLEELQEMRLSELEAEDQVFSASADNRSGKNPEIQYHKHKLANGEIREVEIHRGIVRIHGNDILLLIINDITQRRLIEKQVENYKNYLEELVKARTDDLDFINKQLLLEIKKSKAAEDSIMAQLSFFQTLIDTIPGPIYIMDTNKMFTGCNKAFEDFFSIKKDEIIGKCIYETAPPGLADFMNSKNDELLKNPGKQQFETNFRLPDGKKVHIIENRATYYKSEGQVEGIVAVIINITEIKEMEHEIRKAYEKEKELSELKSRFISVASHEFRTPLTSILAAADLLELYGRKWPEVKYYEYLGDIQKSVEYLTELMNDVLSVSRAETGKITFSPAEVNLYELSQRISESVKVSAKDREIDFNFEYKPREQRYILDDKLITQMLTNILSNAVKYSNDGGKVYFSVDKADGQIIFSVTDAGIGIPEEDLVHLFEPFHRGQNVSAISGTGLGLSIAKRATELHNGTIKIKSEVNKGTEVTISLDY